MLIKSHCNYVRHGPSPIVLVFLRMNDHGYRVADTADGLYLGSVPRDLEIWYDISTNWEEETVILMISRMFGMY